MVHTLPVDDESRRSGLGKLGGAERGDGRQSARGTTLMASRRTDPFEVMLEGAVNWITIDVLDAVKIADIDAQPRATLCSGESVSWLECPRVVTVSVMSPKDGRPRSLHESLYCCPTTSAGTVVEIVVDFAGLLVLAVDS